MGKTTRFSDRGPTKTGQQNPVVKFNHSSLKWSEKKSILKYNQSATTLAQNTGTDIKDGPDPRFHCEQPIYLNEKFGLSYPLLPDDSERKTCPARDQTFMREIVCQTRFIENIGDNRSLGSRALHKLEERLSTGFYRFLNKYETKRVEPLRKKVEPCCPCDKNYPEQICCMCGSDCPVKNIDEDDEIKRTFHVPTCPEAMPVRLPKSPVSGLKVCPYSPNACPLGMKCPFPVESEYDPSAPMPQPPPCPALAPQNRCPLAPPQPFSSNTSCPLDPIKPLPHLNPPSVSPNQPACPLAQKPPSCPLSTPPAKPCPLQNKSDCPLLNCSLGPLKNWIFSDGDPCPFCNRPCCPLVTPEGPGCPILKPTLLCPMAGEKGVDCALASAGPCPPAGPQCPIGLLMERKRREAQGACPCGPQPAYEVEKSCPMSGAVECPALSKSNGQPGNQAGVKPNNCPFPEPDPCPLASPKCPLGPPEPACPLARKVNCPLEGGGGCPCSGGSFGGLEKLLDTDENKIDCPVKYPPCDLFPQGRCPQKDLNLCKCDYPVAPCLEPLLCGDEPAKEQYCFKKDCCMGLPWPPLKPAVGGKFETGTWYKFRDRIPGYELTKHYVDILDEPPKPEFFTGRSTREHDNWLVVEAGKGYRQCEKVKELIESRGPMEDASTQFNPKDNPIDPETKLVMDNREAMEKALKDMERKANLNEWKD